MKPLHCPEIKSLRKKFPTSIALVFLQGFRAPGHQPATAAGLEIFAKFGS